MFCRQAPQRIAGMGTNALRTIYISATMVGFSAEHAIGISSGSAISDIGVLAKTSVSPSTSTNCRSDDRRDDRALEAGVRAYSHERRDLCPPEIRQHSRALQEASETCSFAIPGKSDDAVGYLRTGEKETPREGEAQILGGIYAHVTRVTSGCKPPRHERLVPTEAALRAAGNPKLNA